MFKRGSKVRVFAIRARKPSDKDILQFQKYRGARGVIASVFKYPPHDPKYEIQITEAISGPDGSRKVIARESELEVA